MYIYMYIIFFFNVVVTTVFRLLLYIIHCVSLFVRILFFLMLLLFPFFFRYVWAGKLVRGAYMVSERERAKEQGYESPVFDVSVFFDSIRVSYRNNNQKNKFSQMLSMFFNAGTSSRGWMLFRSSGWWPPKVRTRHKFDECMGSSGSIEFIDIQTLLLLQQLPALLTTTCVVIIDFTPHPHMGSSAQQEALLSPSLSHIYTSRFL